MNEFVKVHSLDVFFWRCDDGFPSRSRVIAKWPAPDFVSEKNAGQQNPKHGEFPSASWFSAGSTEDLQKGQH